MKTLLFESSLKELRRFTALILTAFLFISTATAQISYTQDFEGSAAGWTGTFAWTGQDNCAGLFAMTDQFDALSTTGNLTSPLIGPYGVGGLHLAVSFDYKIVGGTVGFGSMDVQYATSSSGPWTTAYTIDGNNHLVSASCVRANVPLFMMPANSPVYIRFNVNWASGAYTVVIDNILIANKWHTDHTVLNPCWGLVKAPLTFYYGVTQWYWFKNKLAGAVNYTWTNVGSGTLKPGDSPYTRYLFEPTGPTVVTCVAEIAPLFTYTYVYNMAWDNQYFAYKLGYTWYLKICNNGVNMDVPWTLAKTMICNGNATLGYCSPQKTDLLVANKVLTMEVFPNPSEGEIVVRISNPTLNTTISIFDLSSKVILQESVSASENELIKVYDLSYLPNGLFIMQVNDGNTILTEKIVISH